MLSLYRCVVVPILSNWTEIDDLATFDSACCNSKWRTFFMGLFRGNNFTHDTQICHDSLLYFKWLGVRQIKVKNLCLKKFKNSRDHIRILESVLDNLFQIRLLEIEYGPILEKVVEKFENKIECLNIDGNVDEGKNILNIFSKLYGLKTLVYPSLITDFNKFDTGIYENTDAIVEHLSSLHTYEGDFLLPRVWLQKIHNLKRISLASIIDQQHLSDIADCCPLLEHFSTSQDSNGNDSDIIKIAENCPNLVHFAFSCEAITDISVVKLIQTHINITYLDISCCDITDQSVIAVADSLQMLKALNVGLCDKISDKSMILVAKRCVLLEDVVFSLCPLITSLTILELSDNNRSLTSLGCRNCPDISDFSIKLLMLKCKKLQHLDVNSTKVTENALIRCVTNAYTLLISQDKTDSQYCTMSREIFEYNHTPQSHVELYIPTFTAMDPQAYIKMTVLNPNLRILELTSLHNLTGDILIAMVQNCIFLTEVRITDCHRIVTEASILTLVKACMHIHTLSLSKMIIISISVVGIIVENAANLTSLTLNSCGLTNNGLTAIANNCTNTLQYVDISNNSLVTDADVEKVLVSCQQLTALNASECVLLTDITLINISNHCTKLRKISLNNCNKLTKNGVFEFAALYSKVVQDVEFSCD